MTTEVRPFGEEFEEEAPVQKALVRSLIPGVPQIARSKGWQKRFKLAVMLFCLISFLYQTYAFVLIFLKYPVTLVVEIEHPDGILVPAFTMCTGNSFHRGRYCHKFPDHCSENGTVLKEYLNVEDTMSRDLLNEVGLKWLDQYFLQDLHWTEDDLIIPKEVLKIPVLTERGLRTQCYVINHQIFAINESKPQMPTTSDKANNYLFTCLRVFVTNYRFFTIRQRLGPLMVSYHSPYLISNPYMEGAMLDPGDLIFVHMTLQETRLLPAPYPTDCFDYQAQWRQDPNSPLSRTMCIQKCIYLETLQRCGCYPLGNLYPANDKFCENEDAPCLDQIDQEECYKSCKPDCVSLQYNVELANRRFEQTLDVFLQVANVDSKATETENMTHNDEMIGFTMFLKSPNKMVYRYKPKYEVIELFSYVGGYIGVWLGISIASILDFVEIGIRLSYSLLKKPRI